MKENVQSNVSWKSSQQTCANLCHRINGLGDWWKPFNAATDNYEL